jgi:hypothetical protein
MVGKPEGKRSLRRRTHMWEDDIKIGLGGRKYHGKDWIYLARDKG